MQHPVDCSSGAQRAFRHAVLILAPVSPQLRGHNLVPFTFDKQILLLETLFNIWRYGLPRTQHAINRCSVQWMYVDRIHAQRLSCSRMSSHAAADLCSDHLVHNGTAIVPSILQPRCSVMAYLAGSTPYQWGYSTSPTGRRRKQQSATPRKLLCWP